ncbi:MAG: cysteine dioxygenase family protein [bacterium]
MKKGQFVVEPGIAISSFVEKINKLSYKNFPPEDVLTALQKDMVPFELLDPYIFFSDARYTRNLIHKTDGFEVVLMCWNPGQKSPVKNLMGTLTWFGVERGMLDISYFQEEPSSGSNSKLKKLNLVRLKQGSVEFPSRVYSFENNSDSQVVSLHLFVPPSSQCEIYDIELGTKRTVPLSYHSIHGKLVAPEDKR